MGKKAKREESSGINTLSPSVATSAETLSNSVQMEKVVPLSEHTGDNVHNISDAGFWVGKDGAVHKAGTSLLGVFVGQDTGHQIGNFFGGLEDQGIEQLNNRPKN